MIRIFITILLRVKLRFFFVLSVLIIFRRSDKSDVVEGYNYDVMFRFVQKLAAVWRTMRWRGRARDWPRLCGPRWTCRWVTWWRPSCPISPSTASPCWPVSKQDWLLQQLIQYIPVVRNIFSWFVSSFKIYWKNFK